MPAAVLVQLLVTVLVTVPIKDPTYDVSSSVFFYGHYDVPTTIDSTQPLPLEPLEILKRAASRAKRRSAPRVHRDTVYRAIELLLEKVGGMPGRACLLRSICEAASFPLEHDGLVGQLLHVILTPSSTAENGGLHSDYPAAEELGRRGADCGATFPACPATPLDLISTVASWVPP